MIFVPVVAKKHPVVWTLYISLKLLSLVLYFLTWLVFSDYFILFFIIIIIVMAVDFWCTKNISGRLLVGYRWWNLVNEDGTNEWKFETIEDRSIVSGKNSRLFWIVLWSNCVIWLVLAILNSLRFRIGWLMMTVGGFLFAVINVYGFIKCSRRLKMKYYIIMHIYIFFRRSKETCEKYGKATIV
jgi:hypothetical protein